MENERIILEDGREIEIDDTPHYVKDGTLYVFMPIYGGYGYKPMGKVKENDTSI